MKISAILACAAAAKVSRHARSQSLFDEMFGGKADSGNERFAFSASDSLYQVFQFYLMNGGKDFTLADTMTSYGCWCQIRNHAANGIVPGHGTPMDKLDELCHAWQQCRSCTTVDSVDASCDPNSTPYEVGFDPITMRIDCAFNPSDCAINSCKCDEQLAFELTAALDDMNTDFITNQDGSGFDHANQCKASSNGGSNSPGGGNGGNGNGNNGAEATTQCCGSYPNRFTYSDKGGVTQCCGDATYNSNKHDCCNNSFLAGIGSCDAQ